MSSARLLALLAALLLGASPAFCQILAPDGAASPAANWVNEETLLDEAPRISGRIDIPTPRASVLIQPAGREWDYFHQVQLHWLSFAAIGGMLMLLAIVYLVRGPVRITGGRAGISIPRFSQVERFAHWLVAVPFVLLAATGLNLTFGKDLLLPLVGPTPFSLVTAAGKYIHNFSGLPFALGLLLICALWLKDNIPRRVDGEWIRRGGGFIHGRHAPAGRFNAGEKAVFWFAMLAGVAVSVTGFVLLFPFAITDIRGMQVAQVVHAVVAVVFVAVILAHIYIGTVGMEGAFEAMGSGTVDLNWAKEHHDQWLADQTTPDRVDGRKASPAE